MEEYKQAVKKLKELDIPVEWKDAWKYCIDHVEATVIGIEARQNEVKGG